MNSGLKKIRCFSEHDCNLAVKKRRIYNSFFIIFVEHKLDFENTVF